MNKSAVTKYSFGYIDESAGILPRLETLFRQHLANETSRRGHKRKARDNDQ